MAPLLFHSVYTSQILPPCSRILLLEDFPWSQFTLLPRWQTEGQGFNDPWEQPSPSNGWQLVHHPAMRRPQWSQALLAAFSQSQFLLPFSRPPILITCPQFFFPECVFCGVFRSEQMGWGSLPSESLLNHTHRVKCHL